MSEEQLFNWLVLAELVLGVVTWVSLVFVTAPYGRHARKGWGPAIPARLGWVVMESPAVFFFCWVFAQGSHRAELVPLILLGAWQFHYVHRTLVYPLRMRIAGKKMPMAIPLLAFAFNVLNAYLNARWISQLGEYADGWLRDPRFLGGAVMFLAGWFVNVRSDAVLFRLRKPGEIGYKIPRGGLHERVACPNYLGEITEWIGFTLMSWSPAALAFTFYTVANLVPRAAAHLRWYRANFPDYPARRKALIPHLW